MNHDSIAQTALDQMVTTEQQQMLKATVPYLPPSARQLISVFTKLQELYNTITLFSPKNMDLQICETPTLDPLEVLEDVRRFCYGKSRQNLDQMVNMIAIAQMFQVMNESSDKKEGGAYE